MDDVELALGCAFAAVLVVWGLVALVVHEVKKGPGKKPNVRVPRHTLWERTNRYHGRG